MVQINGLNFLIGADPEFFVQQGGKPVSAHGLIPGDKKAPHKVKGGAVQVDGMALEFNINPAKDYKEFEANLNGVMAQILAMVPRHEFFDSPVAEFGADYIAAQPREAKELGCDPDYNAYTGKANPRPDGDAPFRTASGHIHIGWTNDVDPQDPGHFMACRKLSRALDLYLGVPSLLFDRDNRRRELYGKAGAFRPKPYGMEYRTLSNKWLDPKTPHLKKFVYNNTMEAIKAMFKDDEVLQTKVQGQTAQEIIDNNSVETVYWAVKYDSLPVKSSKDYREVA